MVNAIYSATGFTYMDFRSGSGYGNVEKDLFGSSSNPRPVTLNIDSGSWMGPSEFPVANFGGSLVLIYSSVISVGNTHAVSITTTEPGPPQSLTVTGASSTGMTLGWSAPSSVGGSAITGYTEYVLPTGMKREPRAESPPLYQPGLRRRWP